MWKKFVLKEALYTETSVLWKDKGKELNCKHVCYFTIWTKVLFPPQIPLPLSLHTFPVSTAHWAWLNWYPASLWVWQSGSDKRYGARFLTRATQTASPSFPGGESELCKAGSAMHTIYSTGGNAQGNIHTEWGPRRFSQFIGKNTGCEHRVEVEACKGWTFHGLYAVLCVLIRDILKNPPPPLVNVLMKSDSI